MATVIEQGTDAGRFDTVYTMLPGDEFRGALTNQNDRDYVRASLSEDRLYRITLDPGSNEVGFRLRLERPDLGVIETNFDAIGRQNAVTYFAPQSSGDFYIGLYSREGQGGYSITLEDLGPAIEGTPEQFAQILTTGYWNWSGDVPSRWQLDEARSLTYSFENFSEPMRIASAQAFETISYYTGITFEHVASGGQIRFQPSDSTRSFADLDRAGNSGFLETVTINLSDTVMAEVNRPGGWTESVILHEIGHALGLGHSGLYNNAATYGEDSTYVNDTELMSMMSYFHPEGVTEDRAFWRDRALTPMPADLVALETLYGLPEVATGDDVYGYLTNSAGPSIYSGVRDGIFTILDDGGLDTFDFSARPFASEIDLREGGISPAGGGNVGTVIAPGTVIENAFGGAGFDRITGNDVANLLRGGNGADTIVGGAGADTIEGGSDANDLRDIIYGGAGEDSITGGHGNDELRGDADNDVIDGGFGADRIIGGSGNDRLSGGALSDELFGGAHSDFLNGGFGNDRLNGGAGPDTFFHLGIADHGSDWVQDYGAGDVLAFGGQATAAQFQVNTAVTAGAGSAVAEAFVIYRPTGQVLWALVDGADDQITITAGGESILLA